MAGLGQDMEGAGEPPFEPPPRPASTSILPDGRELVVHPRPTKRRSKPESLTKVATINSARDRLSQRRGADNLRELYESPPRLLRREDATVGQPAVDYRERAMSVYAQFPAANGEGDESLISSICNFFPAAPTGVPSSTGSSVASSSSSSSSSSNNDLVKRSSALLNKDLPPEPFLQDQIPFKDLLPKPPKHSAKSSLETSTTDGALSFVAAYDGAFDTPPSPTGQLADSNIASTASTIGLTGTQLSPISDHTEPSTARGSPANFEVPNQRRRRIGATIGGSPRSRRTLRTIGSVIGGRPSQYYLTPQPPRRHIAHEMRPPLVNEMYRQAVTSQPEMIDGATDTSPILPTAVRRFTKYQCGATYREASDAHEVIMGYPRGGAPPDEMSNGVQSSLGSKTIKKGSARGSAYNKSASNVAANTPRSSPLEAGSVLDRLTRPTATSARREIIGKDRRRQSGTFPVVEKTPPAAQPKKAVNVPKVNPVKKASKGFKTKLSSLMAGRGKSAGRVPVVAAKYTASDAIEEGEEDNRLSRNMATYRGSGMDRRTSQLPRPYATTPDLTEHAAAAEDEDVFSPRPSTSHDQVRSDERYPSLQPRAPSSEHTLRVDAHASRAELGEAFRARNAGLMDGQGRFYNHSNASAGPSSAANGGQGRFYNHSNASAGPSSAANGPVAFTSAAAVAGPSSVPTPPATQGGGPVIANDVYGNVVDEMLRAAERSLRSLIQTAGTIQDEAMKDELIDIIEALGHSIAHTRTVRIEIMRQTEVQIRLSSRLQLFAAQAVAQVQLAQAAPASRSG